MQPPPRVRRACLLSGGLARPFRLYLAVLDQPSQRLPHGLQRTVAGLVVEQASRFGDAAVGTVGDMVPGPLSLFLGHALPPLLPGQEAQAGRLPEPTGDSLSVATQGQRCGRDYVEALSHRDAPTVERTHESLGHVVGVDVMHRLHPEVGEGQFLPPCQPFEDREVEVPGGVNWCPARTHYVSGMQDCSGEAPAPRFVEQVRFDPGLLDSVVPERTARLILGSRHLCAVTVHPDGPAVQEVRYSSSQRVDQLAGALRRKADHVYHGVRLQPEYSLPEGSLGLLSLAVQRHLLDGLPGGMDLIRLSLSAADRDYLVARLDQAGHEEGANVPATPDHHDAHQLPPQQSLESEPNSDS